MSTSRTSGFICRRFWIMDGTTMLVAIFRAKDQGQMRSMWIESFHFILTKVFRAPPFGLPLPRHTCCGAVEAYPQKAVIHELCSLIMTAFAALLHSKKPSQGLRKGQLAAAVNPSWVAKSSLYSYNYSNSKGLGSRVKGLRLQPPQFHPISNTRL